MSVRSTSEAAIRVTMPTVTVDYELCWYDSEVSIVPLWWLGAWDIATRGLVLTDVHQGSAAVSPTELFGWLAAMVPDRTASVLVGGAAEVVVRMGLAAG